MVYSSCKPLQPKVEGRSREVELIPRTQYTVVGAVDYIIDQELRMLLPTAG